MTGVFDFDVHLIYYDTGVLIAVLTRVLLRVEPDSQVHCHATALKIYMKEDTHEMLKFWPHNPNAHTPSSHLSRKFLRWGEGGLGLFCENSIPYSITAVGSDNPPTASPQQLQLLEVTCPSHAPPF